MNFQGPVRRTDLYLRATYPEVITTIYQINALQFIIKCENVDENFESFRENFNYSIRPIGSEIDISIETPKDFISIVPNILDNEISKNFEGIPFTKAELLNLLISKFPNVQFCKIEDGLGTVTIYTASFEKVEGNTTHMIFLNNSDRERIQNFLDNLKSPIEFSIVDEKVEHEVRLRPFEHLNPVQFIYASSFKRDIIPEYTLRDEALWFDNIDKIFDGKFSKNDLYFFNSSEYSCYVDFSCFDNIDIRNHLFLFQTVYITLPFEKNIDSWLNNSKIKKYEFLELIQRNRIKVVLTQPESRYEIGFLNEIYETNPLAVISRRAIATLQQIDIVEMSNNYLLNDIELVKELKTLCEIISQVTKVDAKNVFDILVWPIRARRNSFESLNSGGLFSMPSFGVNTAIEKGISEIINKDLSFEFTVNASPIHLANSLNATYFPFKTLDGYSDSFYANVMGEMLNFYKSANTNNIKSFIENKQKINSGILPINPIEIIEVNDFISITEFENILSKDIVYPSSKKLIETLSDLSDEDRKIKIDKYNFEVNKQLNKKDKSDNAIDLGQNILLDAAGVATGIPIIGSAFSLLKLGGKQLTKSLPLIKKITNKIESALHTDQDQANIHYLTKINRVAHIRRNL